MGKRAGIGVASALLALAAAVPVASAARADDPAPPPCTKLAVIGDSLTVGAAPYLTSGLTAVGIHDYAVDAERGRHIRAKALKSGVRALRDLRAKGFTPDCFVVALGTNDIMMTDDTVRYESWVDEMLAEIGDFPVLWVNVAFAKFDSRAVAFNEVVQSRQIAHPGLLVADWRTEAAPHPEWLAIDKLHLRRPGYEYRGQWLTQLILTELYGEAPADVLPACTITKRLRLGMTHDDVVCLETRLEQLGFTMPGGPNRKFDTATYRAVARFQRRHWMAPNGIVGPSTLVALGFPPAS